MLKKYMPPPSMFRFAWLPVKTGALGQGRWAWLEQIWDCGDVQQPMEMFEETEQDRLEARKQEEVNQTVKRLMSYVWAAAEAGAMEVAIPIEDYCHAAVTPLNKWACVSILDYVRNFARDLDMLVSVSPTPPSPA